MEVYLFFIAIGMVVAQDHVPQQPPQGVPQQPPQGVPQQPPQGVPVQQQAQAQHQVPQQVPVGQAQPNIQIQHQQQQLLKQQEQIIKQQQAVNAANMQQHGQQTVHHQANGNSFIRDKTHIQDREHMKLHLNGVIDSPEQDLSEKDMQLHYFKVHDYDNNMKLDGLEILQAVSHFHGDGDEENDVPPLDDKQFMQLIDPILAEDDKNKDGYVDYPEFAASQVQGE